MKRKSIRLKALTVGMTAILAIQTPVMSLQAAAASTQYLSEVILSYGKTDDEAKSWLTQNGYKVVGQNLNEGGEGGTEALSWLGLASEKRSVYLGYKTTTNPEEAITDMKIMNMNGGYSYEAYEKVLADTAAEKEHFLENIMAALKEYRENYKKGAVKAKIAHDNLNKFKDDDSGALMGDLLLNSLKTEDEAAWEADKTQHADMVTILMQGNSTCVSEIMQNLAFAADTADDSFVNRAIAAAESSEKQPFDAFFDAYMEKHPADTKDDAVTELVKLYDDDAKMFASSLIGLKNYFMNYTNSQLSINATAEEAEKYFAEHEYESAAAWASAANTFTVLSGIFYGDTSLAAYLVYPEEDYLSDDALLSGYDALGLPQRARLYPFVAQMSAGQRALLEYTAMDRLLTMGLMDAETWQTAYAKMQDDSFGAKALETCSVYAEVNRDDFKVGEIAVTNMAQGKQASTGESMNEGLFGTGVSYTTAGLFVGGIAVSVAGIAIAAKNWSTVAPAVSKTIEKAPSAFQTAVKNYNDKIRDIFLRDLNGTKMLQNNPEIAGYFKSNRILDVWSGEVEDILTNAGANYDIIGFVRPQLKEIEGNKYILFSDGTTVNINTGKPGPTDLKYAEQVKNSYQEPNPDLVQKVVQTQEVTKQVVEKTQQELLEEANNAINNTLSELMMGETALGINIKSFLKGTLRIDPNTPLQDLTKDQAEQLAKYLKKIKPESDFEVDMFLSQHDKLREAAAMSVANNADDLVANAGKAMSEYIQGIKDFDDYWAAALETYHLDPKLTPLTMDPDDFQNVVNKMEYDSGTDLSKFRKMKAEYQEAQEAAKSQNSAQQISDKADDLAAAGKEGADKVDDAAEAAMTAGSGSTFWKWFGVGMAIVGLIMSAYSVYAAISEMKEYYHQEMLPIPRKMVDLGYYDDGTTCYIYYDCVKCNRTAMNMGNETLGDYGDLNGDVMKQWLALYTTKDTRAGKPILANITVKKGTTSIPMKTVPLSFFGFKSAVNMTDTKYTYNNAKNGIYLYYKQDAAAYTGTVATGNLYVTVGVLSALGGAGICGILIALLGKRRKKDEQPTETQAA